MPKIQMEKQINQPTTVPEKNGINYWMLSSIVLLTIVISGWFYIASINNATPFQNNRGEITQSPTIVVPTETLTPTTLKPTDGMQYKDWKTYKSDKYNLEFKYPSTFTQMETSDSIYLESIPQGAPMISFEVDYVDYYDNLIDKIKKLSEEEAKRQGGSFLVSESEYKIGNDQSIQGYKMVLREFLNGGGSYDEEIIYFRVGSHSFGIRTFNNSNKKIRDQVLYTLKILN